MKAAWIEQLQQLLKEENFDTAYREIQKIEKEYGALISEESKEEGVIEESEKAEELEVENSAEATSEVKEPEVDKEDVAIQELLNLAKEQKKLRDKEKAEEQENNLKAKQKIISSIKELIDEEENIGRAFSRFNALRDEWKEIGQVSPHKYKDLQAQYSQQIEEFYYNINIYKALKDHDLKKNLQEKKELIIQMEKLLKNDSIKQVETLARGYLIAWDDIGPTFKEEWEAVRDKFREVTSEVYTKIREHYKNLKEGQKENLEKKEELCKKVEEINELEIKSHKKWKEKTEEVLACQKEWKAIGFALKKKNEEIWERFRSACDTFFANKSAFYSEANATYSESKDKKMALIEKAEALRDNTDWKNTSAQLVKLQARWKEIGTAGPRDEQKLWNRFRAACNHFFEAKHAHFESQKDQQKENLKAKKELLGKIESHKLSGKADDDLKAIEALAVEWEKIGFVPRDKAGSLNNAFREQLDKLYKQLPISDEERTKAVFDQKINRLSASQNSGHLLEKEVSAINGAISKQEAVILQYENNLGFFKYTADDNPMKKEVLDKIEAAKGELEKLKNKRKQIKQAMRS